MNEEEKQLLVIDLCGRLHSGVKLSFNGNAGIPRELTSYDRYGDKYFFCAGGFTGLKIESIKPYLRSLETMTEEEQKQLNEAQEKDEKILCKIIDAIQHGNERMMGKAVQFNAEDWCNKNHFDYRGLIPMGLAIKVTKENNPYKKY